MRRIISEGKTALHGSFIWLISACDTIVAVFELPHRLKKKTDMKRVEGLWESSEAKNAAVVCSSSRVHKLSCQNDESKGNTSDHLECDSISFGT